MEASSSTRFPVFIPSRGRWKNTKGTAALLTAARIPFTIVVEPHETALYRDLLSSLSSDERSVGCVATLPQSHQGVTFARNFILSDLAPLHGWFWVMDDDIQSFNRAVDRINKPIAPCDMFDEVCKRMEKHPNAAIYSIDYPFFAWQYGDDALAVNSYNNIAVLINKERLPEGIQYRFRIREDYDFTLQVILAGKTTIRFRNLSYVVPRMAAAQGGMTDYYQKQKDDIRLQNNEFVAMWPSVSFETVKGTGAQERHDICVKWIKLHPARCKDPVAVLKSREPLVPPVATERRRKSTSASCGKNLARKRVRSEDDSEDEEDDDWSDDDTSSGDSCLDSEVESCESSEDGEEGNVNRKRLIAHRPPRRRAPKPPAPPKEKVLPGWKGYTIEKYRDVTPETALSVIGLQRIPEKEVKIGSVVIVIPYSLELPGAVEACVLEVTRCPAPQPWQWTVAIEGIRKAPLLSISHCYRRLPGGTLETEQFDIGAIASLVDRACQELNDDDTADQPAACT